MLDKEKPLGAQPFGRPQDRSRDALPGTLHEALNAATGAAHRRLDTRLSHLNLHLPAQRANFCRIQLLGFRALGAACGWQAAEGTSALRRQVEALAREVGDFSDAEPEPSPDDTPAMALHPDAAAFVVLGAQMGGATLRRDLSEAERSGCFSLVPDLAAWEAFCLRIRHLDADSPQGQTIQRDARDAFGLFLGAADLVIGPEFP